MNVRIAFPAWFEPFLGPARYKAAYGGRASGKSHTFADYVLRCHLIDPNSSTACIRETQRSMRQSVKRLLEAKIAAHGIGSQFTVLDSEIRNNFGSGVIIFEGMQNHTADSLKSLEGFDRAFVEEAQSLSQRSMDLLRPTIRKPGSELLFVWNPRSPDDAVDKLLRGEERPPRSIVRQVNWRDNPHLPPEIREEMESDKARDISKFLHVWEGAYETSSEARVFANWTVQEFDAPADAHHRFGADWGYSTDPTVLVRCHIVGRRLFVDYEAWQVGCEIRDTPSLFLTIPDAERWPIVADSSRPETISHVRRSGFHKIQPSVKGPNSVHDGIEWLKSFDIVVHPRCTNVIRELAAYSFKRDRHTDEVTAILEDRDNHTIDALRYACEAARRIAAQRPARVEVPRWREPAGPKAWMSA